MRIRTGATLLALTASTAIAAPAAGAYVATGDGGSSAAKASAQAERPGRDQNILLLSVLFGTTTLAAFGAAGAAMTRRRPRDGVATLTL